MNTTHSFTTPLFEERAQQLAFQLAQHMPADLQVLLNINEKIASQTFLYYQNFLDKTVLGTPSVFTFQGLAYKNLSPETLSANDLQYAQENLKILSAMYGVLRPFDVIKPYRLDFMGSFAKQKREGKNLYQYWGEDIFQAIYKETDIVVNLCSGEYEKLVMPFCKPPNQLVSCQFLVQKGSKLVCQATASKMARGQMARFIIQNKITNPIHLCEFEWNDYAFSSYHSNSDVMTFIRTQ